MKQLKMAVLLIIFSIIMICCGCESSENKNIASNTPIRENDMIIGVSEKELVKTSEDEVIKYFNEKKNDFIALDDFRKIAWSKLSEGEKKSVVIESNKAIVVLEDGKNIGYKLDKSDYEFVVSVQFNTDVDGVLGPIIMYFYPSTKELVGYNIRM